MPRTSGNLLLQFSFQCLNVHSVHGFIVSEKQGSFASKNTAAMAICNSEWELSSQEGHAASPSLAGPEQTCYLPATRKEKKRLCSHVQHPVTYSASEF